MPAVVAEAIVRSDWQAGKAAELPHLTVAFAGKSASGEAAHLADRTANVNWQEDSNNLTASD
jgi:hypothetical protein